MKKGFTLIELMVVIVIIGILAAIAIPRLTSMSAKSKVSEAPQVIAGYERLQQAYITEVSKTGNFSSIKFTTPDNGAAPGESKFFVYTDDFTADNADAGITAATLAEIGDCAAASEWVTVVALDGKAERNAPAGDCGLYTPNF